MARLHRGPHRRTLAPMATRFYQLVVEAHDPSRLAHWWAEVLGYDVLYETANEVIIGTDPAHYPGICFVPSRGGGCTCHRARGAACRHRTTGQRTVDGARGP